MKRRIHTFDCPPDYGPEPDHGQCCRCDWEGMAGDMYISSDNKMICEECFDAENKPEAKRP